MERPRLEDVPGDLDLLVIGGGIIGTARDAALRGLRVALFEKRDFSSGTTAASSRLVHGGLRYLEMLDFGLVRLDLRERETLLRIAPHLVRPLEFLIPFYDRSLFHRLKLRAGLALYDLLSYDRSLPGHRALSVAEVRAAEPALRAEGLQGGAAYWDAQAPLPERLCLENVLDAAGHGALCLNYAEVTGLLERGGTVAGLRVHDHLTGATAEVRGRVVINASGPWLDRVDARLGNHRPPRLRTTKGAHLACAPLNSRALVLFSKVDGRLFFALPWLDYTYLSTTDTDFADEPAAARATAADVDYLLDSAGGYLPVTREQVYFTHAGVRALVMEPGRESAVSRMHRIVDEAATGRPGLIAVLGGKITGYRAIAEEATDLACRRLGLMPQRRATTHQEPLPGAAAPSPPRPAELPEATWHHLVGLYGCRASEVAALAATAPTLSAPLTPDGRDVAAQVVFAVREESCRRVSDFHLRRSALGFRRDRGLAALPAVADWMARELGWSDEERAAEVEDYHAWVQSTRSPSARARS